MILNQAHNLLGGFFGATGYLIGSYLKNKPIIPIPCITVNSEAETRIVHQRFENLPSARWFFYGEDGKVCGLGFDKVHGCHELEFIND